MKKLLFSAAILAFTTTAFAQGAATPSTKLTVADVAKFSTETIDFGKIKQGVPAKGTFIVTNISKSPLLIEQANPTCGCTISDYTKEPIAAGKTGVINATYNAANAGQFSKHLTVKFNGVDEVKSIELKGEVLPAAEYDTWKVAFDARQKAVADSIAQTQVIKTHKHIKTKKTTTTTTKTTTSK